MVGGPPGFTEALAARVRALRDERGAVMVGLDGRGAMGKSTLAAKLAQALGPGTEVLGIDAFFLPVPRHPPFDRHQIGHLRMVELGDVVAAIRRGEATTYRPYDWDTADLGLPVEIRPGLVIVEGLYALRREVDPGYDFRIWIEGELGQRMARVFERSGGASRDEARADPFARLWREEFGPREQTYIETERPWEDADLIVAGPGLSVSDIGRQLLTPAPSELSPEPLNPGGADYGHQMRLAETIMTTDAEVLGNLAK